MGKFQGLSIVVLLLTAPACARQQTWGGTIGDSVCSGMHPFDEHALPMTDKDCTLRCIKDGAKFVLVSNDKMYAIQNQDYPALAEYAGAVVQLTGRLQRDGIVVTNIELGHAR
jgi:hypothetical protein